MFQHLYPFLMGQQLWLLQQQQALLVVVASTPRTLQVAKASNRNIVVGNLGPVMTGTQTASPLNVGR